MAVGSFSMGRGVRRTRAGARAGTFLTPAGLEGWRPGVLAQPATPVTASPAGSVQDLAEHYLTELDLKALLVHVTRGDDVIASLAVGESMIGVPATADMHFRNGAVAISLVSMLTLILVDEGVFGLDDTIGQWVPDLPEANAATIRMLANMTAGYRDYVQSTDLANAQQDDPFQNFTVDELLGYSLAQPRVFAPGDNWEYSHTCYVILGQVMELATGTPVEQLMQEKVLDPLGLTETRNSFTAAIPEPVLHAFTSERRQWLGIPDDVPFHEESTYWNPSWSITHGAVQVSTVADMAASMAAVGRGTLLSSESHAAMLGRELVGFGAPVEGCASCHTMTEEAVYGLGVWMVGPWVLQNPLFSGYGGTAGYLADQDLAIAVAVTFGAGSFGTDGSYSHGNASTPIFEALAALMTGSGATPVAG